MKVQDRLTALRSAHGHLLARRFDAAMAAAAPWQRDPAGALLHALALAGSGAADRAAPLLARIAAANPASQHPVLDLLPLVSAADGIRHLRAALRERPDDAALWGALGALAAQVGPMSLALEAFGQTARLQPGEATAWSNLGKALAAECRFEAADEAFATARELAPDNRQIAYNRAVSLLKAGRFADGWSALRVRHGLPGRPQALPGHRLADLDVAGRTVLLLHEEGFGDTLQFIRFAPLLAERGARVVAAMPPALARIVRTVPGIAEVTTLPALPRYDLWAPLLDVPWLFGGVVAGGVPYLHAATVAAARPGMQVGAVWAGDPKGLLDHSRSMPVEALAPLRDIAGVRWVSLQKGAAAPAWMAPMAEVRDFADTAAIVAGLDLVVSVDTAVAHLAGGMGKTVVLMDRYDNCWRWLSGRDDSVWYPRMRIVRQTAPGNWADVVRRTGELVAEFAASGAGS